MNAIIGISQLQLQDNGLPDGYAHAVRQIYNSGNDLLGIINDILDLSKIETGKLELNPAEYDIPSLIHDTVQLNIVRIGSSPIEFMLELDETLPGRFFGDELRIKQILNNLLSNAIKYTEKGHVKLSVSHSPGEEDYTFLRFTVEDTGQGMKPEDRERLFTEYLRFNIEANRATEGTGIGLNITKRLVEMMDGAISVESEYGKGSVFTVTIRQEPLEGPPIGAALAQSLRSFSFIGERQTESLQLTRHIMPYGKILVVDDVETNLYVALGMLSPYKLQVETAASGFAALDKISAGNAYDIIYMDHMMPQMDGIETTRRIRGLGYAGTVVALTANALAGNREMFLENGFDDFISKRQLDTILKKFVRDKQPPEVIEAALQAAEAAPDASVQNTAKLIPPETVIPGLDIAQGLARYDNNEEIYIKILSAYTASLRTILEACETVSSDEHELAEYKVRVHGIKGASLNIFAEPLAEITYALEKSAAAGNFEYVSEHNSEFLEKGRELMEKLEALLSQIDTENPKPVKEKPDNEALGKLIEACELYDIDEVDAAMEELEKYRYSSDGGLMEWLKERLALMQYPEIIERLKGEI
jgi:CheY-like chemotaxis protein/anti-sigma regulatory factor (Ser/Thr protein kinase)